MAGTSPKSDEAIPVLTATEARQGTRGRPVLYILIIALLLAALAWIASEFYGSAIDTQTPSDGTESATVDTTPRTERAFDNAPLPREKRQTEPALVDPQPEGRQ